MREPWWPSIPRAAGAAVRESTTAPRPASATITSPSIGATRGSTSPNSPSTIASPFVKTQAASPSASRHRRTMPDGSLPYRCTARGSPATMSTPAASSGRVATSAVASWS
ncbi:MAG: hypothetical protein LBH48_07960, partial [Bifidobacteriaceae bacterium]|nr:hypothetical protein [Bifidobacteriaceae bacterium]